MRKKLFSPLNNLNNIICGHVRKFVKYSILSYDAASGSKITPCNKSGKPLEVYRLFGKKVSFSLSTYDFSIYDALNNAALILTKLYVRNKTAK